MSESKFIYKRKMYTFPAMCVCEKRVILNALMPKIKAKDMSVHINICTYKE